MKVWLALLAVVAMATSADAAKLVVIMTNSGAGTVAGAFPPLGAGQKGFLIGVANNTPEDLALGLNPLAFQDITFSGANLVQRLAPNTFANGDLSSPNVQLRTETTLANAGDPVPTSTFAANDSWWWNQQQTEGGQTLTLAAQSTGIQGGAPGGPMTYTASYNPSGTVNPAVWRMAYVVTSGDVPISGILAAGTQGQFSYLLGSGLVDTSKGSHQAKLVYETGQIVDVPVPEPSTIALAGMGLVALMVGAWRRRK